MEYYFSLALLEILLFALKHLVYGLHSARSYGEGSKVHG